MASTDVIEVLAVQDDFSRGMLSGISDLGLGSTGRKSPIRWVKLADNVIFRPRRAASVRGGTEETSTAVLDDPPNSLGKFYADAGNKLFAATYGSSGKMFRRIATTVPVKSSPRSGTRASGASRRYFGGRSSSRTTSNRPLRRRIRR